ncbi:PAS domain-containing protein [Methanococcoides orientis]|uniref:PAS domain-containing protein n=1 Tax=Methanococcoides orientis TaxID=2822137 RepID=UPI001E29EE93|nr:PAS domain-containing protein [Methanococcoides orientis]UGV41123.1 PAS domain-containing protein [Methanococcoides orientis]
MPFLDSESMEEVFSSVVNSSPAVVFIWREDDGWPVDFVSENISQFGYDPDEFTSGKLRYVDILHPDDAGMVMSEASRHVSKEDTSFDLRYRILTRSGDVRWVDERTSVHYDDSGKLKFYHGIVVDITEQRMDDIALLDGALEMKNTLESVINSSPVVVFLWRAEEDWPVEFVSKNIDMFGYSVEEFTSGELVYADIVHPEDIGRVRAGVSKSTEGGYSDFFQEYRILTRSGEVRWVDERTHLHHNSKGEVTYLQGIIVDITGRKKIENVLHTEEMRIEAVLNLYQMTDSSVQEIMDFSLEEAVKLTGSHVGYLAFVDVDEATVTIDSWSGEVMKECSLKDRKSGSHFDHAGLWTESLKQKLPIIINDYSAENPSKSGYPEGHMNITRFLSIPIFERDHVVALVGLVNKAEDYDLSDVRQVSLLMNGMWNILLHKKADAELRRSLDIQKILGDVIKSSPAVVFLWRAEENWPVEFVSENVAQFGYSVDDFISGKLVYGDIVHPYDLERVQKELAKRVDAGFMDFNQEYRIFTKFGDVRWVDERTFIKHDEAGNVRYLQGIIVDVTDRKHSDDFMHVQLDLDTVLSSANTIEETFEQMLSFSLKVDPVDSGRFYLLDDVTGDLKLVAHEGLSERFVKDTSVFPRNSVQNRLVMTGQPVYKHHSELNAIGTGEKLRYEGLHGTAIIPVKHEGKVIAALCLSSHSEYEIPDNSRSSLETIANQIGIAISKMRSSSGIAQKYKDLRSLVDMMDELLVVMDMEGYVLYANRAVVDYLGFLEDDISGMHYLELHPDSEWDQVDSILSKVKVGKTIVFETSMLGAKGPLHKVETRLICGEWSGHPCVMATSRFLD